MKKPISIFYFFFILFSINAQTETAATLKQQLQEHQQKDTSRIALLMKTSNFYSNYNPDSGLLFANEALSLAEDLKMPLFIGRAHVVCAYNYQALYKNTEAIAHFKQAISAFEKAGNFDRKARAYHNMGLAYYNSGDYYAAIEVHKKALEIFSAIGDTKIQSSPINSIGVNFMALDKYDSAAYYYLKSLHLAEENNDTLLIALAYSNLAIVNEKMNYFDDALNNLDTALTLLKAIKDSIYRIGTLATIANVYDTKGDSDSALKYNLMALHLDSINGFQLPAQNRYVNIGIIYFDKKEYEKALEYLNAGIAMSQQKMDSYALGIAYRTYANLLLMADDTILEKYGINRAEKYMLANHYADSSSLLAQQNNDLDGQMYAWEIKSKVYEHQQNFEQALYAFKQYNIFKDSIAFDEKRESVLRSTMQYETDKQQAIATEKIRSQKKLNTIIVISSLILLAGAVISFLFYRKTRESQLKAEVQEVENKALRAQMNPHFIFNSLNSISNYLVHNNAVEADKYLTKFSKVMRMILENSEEKVIPLARDLEFLELYLQLEKARLQNIFNYEILVDEKIDKENTLIPPMLLQPFIENSIWHGMTHKEKEGQIVIEIKNNNGVLTCSVQDNGGGIVEQNTQEASEKKSFGIKITKRRIELMNKIKNCKAQINTFNIADGLKTEVLLPIQTQF